MGQRRVTVDTELLPTSSALVVMKMIITGFLFILHTPETDAVCSPLYGGEPCLFVPAPPGKTPSCARPGLTYCEHSPHYPKELIKHLITLWRYDKRTLFLDESPEEFNSYTHPYPTENYSHKPLPVYGPPNLLSPENHLPEPIYIPKPPFTHNYNPLSNQYIPPSRNFSDFLGYPERRPYSNQEEVSSNQLFNYKPLYKQQEEYNRPGYYNPFNNYQQQQQNFPQPQNNYNYYNSKDWWQRPIRDVKGHLKTRSRRSTKVRRHRRELATLLTASNVTLSSIHNRRKRQSNPTGQTLCQARTQFVMPEAAMNSQGNWMYVVNVQEGNAKFTQLVRSETCVSQQCSGLCGLPTGYTSRCEQKYIQKRLVALEGTGNNLYSDLFWLPSCCVCTLSQS
ncbi:protein spaetzle 5 [Agrilus planipennis]|uniref:Protein spaetzle 5 n=1 Tax=Agrilus planipennis TaxID=224129 RepID=A0A1W4XVT7_AGRPL|nr:protein spaetzle 5 [Agrilus planipennis]